MKISTGEISVSIGLEHVVVSENVCRETVRFLKRKCHANVHESYDLLTEHLRWRFAKNCENL